MSFSKDHLSFFPVKLSTNVSLSYAAGSCSVGSEFTQRAAFMLPVKSRLLWYPTICRIITELSPLQQELFFPQWIAQWPMFVRHKHYAEVRWGRCLDLIPLWEYRNYPALNMFLEDVLHCCITAATINQFSVTLCVWWRFFRILLPLTVGDVTTLDCWPTCSSNIFREHGGKINHYKQFQQWMKLKHSTEWNEICLWNFFFLL